LGCGYFFFNQWGPRPRRYKKEIPAPQIPIIVQKNGHPPGKTFASIGGSLQPVAVKFKKEEDQPGSRPLSEKFEVKELNICKIGCS
jgi:hypothetical protein